MHLGLVKSILKKYEKPFNMASNPQSSNTNPRITGKTTEDSLQHTLHHCMYCQKSFTMRKNLLRHLRFSCQSRLAAPAPLLCSVCYNTYSRSDALLVHIATEHENREDLREEVRERNRFLTAENEREWQERDWQRVMREYEMLQ